MRPNQVSIYGYFIFSSFSAWFSRSIQLLRVHLAMHHIKWVLTCLVFKFDIFPIFLISSFSCIKVRNLLQNIRRSLVPHLAHYQRFLFEPHVLIQKASESLRTLRRLLSRKIYLRFYELWKASVFTHGYSASTFQLRLRSHRDYVLLRLRYFTFIRYCDIILYRGFTVFTVFSDLRRVLCIPPSTGLQGNL